MKLQTQLIALLIASLAPISVVSVSAQGTTQTQSASTIRSTVAGYLPSGVTLETASQQQLKDAVAAAVNANPGSAAQIAAAIAVYRPDEATAVVKAATAAATADQNSVQQRAETLAKIAKTTAVAQSNAGVPNAQSAQAFAADATPEARLTGENVNLDDILDNTAPDSIPEEAGEGDGDTGTPVFEPADEGGAEEEQQIENPDLPATINGITNN